MTTVLDPQTGEVLRVEPGRYRAAACRKCNGTVWRACVREGSGGRLLRCAACGHIRMWSMAYHGVTFIAEDAA